MNKFYFYYSFASFFLYWSASIAFFTVFKSTSGGLWAALAACIAGVSFHLHKLYLDNKLHNFYTTKTMDFYTIFGFIVCLIATAFSVWYVFAIVYWKIPLFDYKETMIFPCVFSFLSGKWSLHLFTSSKDYAKFLSSNYAPLISNN